MEKTGRFTKEERIKLSADIRRLYKTGKKVSVWGAKLFVLENGTDITRVAFTLPRHYGGAVERNKSKRYSRETYRRQRIHVKSGYDLLLLVYPDTDSLTERTKQFCALCKQAGVWRF